MPMADRLVHATERSTRVDPRVVNKGYASDNELPCVRVEAVADACIGRISSRVSPVTFKVWFPKLWLVTEGAVRK
jgi:hypothetical protein